MKNPRMIVEWYKMNEKTKKALTLAAAVILVVVVSVWLILGGTDHIEDTNGADNYALQTITDENIINMDVGSIGGPEISKNILQGSNVEFSAEKLTGVYEVLYDNFVLPSDFEVNLSAFAVNEGNFKMVVVHDDKIVATLEPDLFVDYLLEDVTGTVSLRIAGESASFTFNMSEMDYDHHAHPEND